MGKPQKKKKKTLENPALDLFGEVPVTQDDVDLWILKVAPRWQGSVRIDWYVKSFRVVEKIKRAKLNGEWGDLTR